MVKQGEKINLFRLFSFCSSIKTTTPQITNIRAYKNNITLNVKKMRVEINFHAIIIFYYYTAQTAVATAAKMKSKIYIHTLSMIDIAHLLRYVSVYIIYFPQSLILNIVFSFIYS